MPKVTIYTDTWIVPHTFLGVTDSRIWRENIAGCA